MTFKYFPTKELHTTTLDNVQEEAMQSKNLTKEDVIVTKTIYDFISRFAWVEYGENSQRNKEYTLDEIWVGSNKIPPKTREIIAEIGSENLNLFFSPFAYTQNNGEHFKNLYNVLAKQAPFSYHDFVCDGLISKIKSEDKNSSLYNSRQLSEEVNSGNFPSVDNNDYTVFPEAVGVYEYVEEENEDMGETISY